MIRAFGDRRPRIHRGRWLLIGGAEIADTSWEMLAA